MKTFHIHVPVDRVDGTQVFAVQAEDELSALAEFNRTGGEFVQEELEVVALDKSGAWVEEASS